MMEQVFISNIFIKKIRHLQDVEIVLSDTEKKHLILTGKNGCGKTSVLEKISFWQNNTKLAHKVFLDFLNGKKIRYDFGGVVLEISSYLKSHSQNKYLFYNWNFPAYRTLKVIKSDGVKDQISDHVEDFEKFLAKKRTEQAFLSFEKANQEEVLKISDWFEKLESSLQFLFEDESLKLVTNRSEDKVSFVLKSDYREDFDFNTLSSGYSAVLNIVFDMMQKMQAVDGSFDYTKEGIAIIDEMEAHLHVSLQKKILPFLTGFFPNVQFIVSTHSPFILQSLKNTVIFDLETRKRYENFSDYSSETILENFYHIDQFSDIMKKDMIRYEEMLQSKNGRSSTEILEMRERFLKVSDIEISYWLKDMDIKYRDKIKPLLS